jgi:hypothetical protein
MKERTFGGRGGAFLRSRTRRGLSVQRRKRETTGYGWIDGDCVTCYRDARERETCQESPQWGSDKKHSRNFFQKPFGLR